MTQLLEADKDTVDAMTLTFSAALTSMFDDVVEYDLVQNGKDKPVTNSNKFHFVEVYADFLLNKSIKKSVRATGFDAVWSWFEPKTAVRTQFRTQIRTTTCSLFTI